MSALTKKILAAREVPITVGEWTFTARRPDAMEASKLASLDGQAFTERILTTCVHAWTGVLERDIVGDGGSDQPAEFDRELFVLWVRDRPEVWDPIVTGVMTAMTTWAASVAESRKN